MTMVMTMSVMLAIITTTISHCPHNRDHYRDNDDDSDHNHNNDNDHDCDCDTNSGNDNDNPEHHAKEDRNQGSRATRISGP